MLPETTATAKLCILSLQRRIRRDWAFCGNTCGHDLAFQSVKSTRWAKIKLIKTLPFKSQCQPWHLGRMLMKEQKSLHEKEVRELH